MKYLTTILAALSLLVSCGNNSTAKEPGRDAVPPPTTTPETATAPPEAAKTAHLTCTLNGKAWKGNAAVGGQLYYAKGITGMYGGLPYCSLAFSSTDAPDNRQMTIAFKNFPGKTGVYNKDKLEVLLSGSATGDVKKAELQGHKIPAQATDFSLTISDWKVTKATEVVISGTLSGTLKGVFDAPDVKIENGVFTDVKIIVYNEKY